MATLTVTPQAVAPSITLSEEELAKQFESRKDKYAIPETRRIERIPFPSVEEAQQARARIMQGTPFATVGSERGFTEKDMCSTR